MAVEPPLGPSPFPGLGRWWGWTWNRSLKHQPVVRRDACAPWQPLALLSALCSLLSTPIVGSRNGCAWSRAEEMGKFLADLRMKQQHPNFSDL